MRILSRALIAPFLAALIVFIAPASSDAGSALPQPVERVVYHCSPGPGFDICATGPGGSDWAQFTNDSQEDSAPEISPDGQKIVWERDVLELWTMNPDGSGKQRLIPDITLNPDSPTWAPDGKTIAFICNDPNSLNTDGICTINANGSGFEMIKVIEPRPTHLEWSPDGRYMLVGMEPVTNNEDIFVWDMQTDQLTNVTNTDDEWEHGTWSPDGTEIAFVGTPLPGEPVSLSGLYKMKRDGSDRENLYTSNQGGTATSPAWAPDGEDIVYFCNFTNLCIVQAEGGLNFSLNEDFEDQWALGNDPDWGLTGGTLAGDLDCTNGLSPIDSLKLLRYDGGLDYQTACVEIGTEVVVAGVTLLWGDIDCNGEITPVDSLKLLRYDAGLDVAQEPECPSLGSLLA